MIVIRNINTSVLSHAPKIGNDPRIPSVYLDDLNLCLIEGPDFSRFKKTRHVSALLRTLKEGWDPMTEKKTTAVSRRQLMARIGGLAAAAYAVPAFTTMSMAHASDASAASKASAASEQSSASEPSDPSEPSKASEASGTSTSSTSSMSSGASGCAEGTSWDGKSYNSSGRACMPD